MKTKTRLTFALIIICALVSVFTISANAETVASGTCGADGDNLTWTLDSEGTLTISGEGEMADWHSTWDVPWYSYAETIKNVDIGNNVTTIGGFAFNNFEEISSVTIPDSITRIGSYAFQSCGKLASIHIGKNVKKIYGTALYLCTGLTDISVSADNEYFTADECGVLLSKDKDALYRYPAGKTATSYTVPDTVTEIVGWSLCSSHNLQEINIPESVEIIDATAFFNCKNLLKIEVDASNEFYSSDDKGVLYNNTKTTLLKCPPRINETTYEIPSSVTTIDDSAFMECGNLTEIAIPDSVTTIGREAFDDCRNLTKVTLSNNLLTVEPFLFFACYKLEEIEIPASVASIDYFAFKYCESLAKVTIYNKDLVFKKDNIFSECGSALTLYGYSGSTTQTYAEENSIPFVALDEEEAVQGDVSGDGSVNFLDAMQALRISAGAITATEEQKAAGDVDGNGTVNFLDAMIIMRISAGASN